MPRHPGSRHNPGNPGNDGATKSRIALERSQGKNLGRDTASLLARRNATVIRRKKLREAGTLTPQQAKNLNTQRHTLDKRLGIDFPLILQQRTVSMSEVQAALKRARGRS